MYMRHSKIILNAKQILLFFKRLHLCWHSDFGTSEYSIRRKLTWYLVFSSWNNRVIIFSLLLIIHESRSVKWNWNEWKYMFQVVTYFLLVTRRIGLATGEPSHWIIKEKNEWIFLFQVRVRMKRRDSRLMTLKWFYRTNLRHYRPEKWPFKMQYNWASNNYSKK